MNKIEFRIFKIYGGYFPQVRKKGLIFNSKWRKIGEHVSGFGLYHANDHNYPKTEEEAREIIRRYNDWLNRPKNIEIIEIKNYHHGLNNPTT